MVKCKDNNGIGDCPYRHTCLASLNDRTISGCNLPFAWNGMMPMADAMVEHTITVKDGEQE